MLSVLPTWILIPLLILCGAVVGGFINWAIYSWTIVLRRSISPWQNPAEGASAPAATDRIPVYGWWQRRRDSEVHGKGFWVRPLLIELVWTIGLPLFYFWQMSGGLTGGNPPSPLWGETWFFAHGILLVLMCIGTFIDFDEKTIPDQITIPGTIIALLFAALAPWSRLPEVIPGWAPPPTIDSIYYGSPHKLVDLHLGTTGLLIVLAVWTIWIWALLPKLPVWYVGFKNWIRFMFAYAIQPKRKTKCEFRVRPRRMPMETKILACLFVVGLVAIFLAWKFLPPIHWVSLFGAFLGMAFAGGIIWAIRVLGTLALQQEAMGFGDVTLWAMVGAFLGWQAALMGFFYAPFTALAIVLFLWIMKRENEIAFGPYLCMGAAITLMGWFPIWRRTSQGVFRLGVWLWIIFAGALVLLVVMLLVIAWYKGMFRPMDEEGDDEDH